MKFLFVTYLVILFSWAFGQGGYLGARNSFEVKLDLNPTSKRVTKDRGDYILTSPRVFNPRITFNFARVITRHAEIAIGYELIVNRVYMNNYKYNDIDESFMTGNYIDSFTNGNWLIDDPRFIHHGLNLEYHYYRKGNLAPIGNYIGFALKFGYCRIREEKIVTFGDIGSKIEESSFGRSKNEVFFRGKDTLTGGASIVTSHFNLHLGQNVPIMKRMIFSFQVSLPIFYAAHYNGRLRFSELYPNKFYDDYFTTRLEGFTAYTIGLFYRVSLDIGLKLAF